MTHQELLKRVQWKDLRNFSVREMLIENNLTIPWFLISITLAYYGYYLFALPFSAFFFLTALRQVHNGFHNSLGTNKFLTWFSLFSNSILMMVSIHAVKFNHIRHHKFCLSEDDYEGRAAGMTWYGAMLYGPIHMNTRNSPAPKGLAGKTRSLSACSITWNTISSLQCRRSNYPNWPAGSIMNCPDSRKKQHSKITAP